MSNRAYLSIGDVLTLLRQEFPDVTISKIRFLESQGLVNPERTPSGYRKFYEHDVEQLRWVLRQQREHFLPLKVIKGRLEQEARGNPVDIGADEDEAEDLPELAKVTALRLPVDATVPSGATATPERHLRSEPAMMGSAVARASEIFDGLSAISISNSQGSSRGEFPPSGRGEASGPGQLPGFGQAEFASPDGGSAEVPGTPSTHPDQRNVEPNLADSTVTGIREGASGYTEAPRFMTGYGDHEASRENRGATEENSGASQGDPGDNRLLAGQVPSTLEPKHLQAEHSATSATLSDPITPDLTPSLQQSRISPYPSELTDGPSSTGSSVAAPTGHSAGRPAGVVHTQSSSGASLTIDELAGASGMAVADVMALESFGLLGPKVVGGIAYYDEDALTVARLAAGFARYGIEARHLRQYKLAADREAGFVEQIVLPLLKQRNPEARQRANQTVADLTRLGQGLHSALLRSALGDRLGG